MSSTVESKNILLIISTGVDGGLALKESLDMAMVSAAFGQNVSLLFMGDALYHWCNAQQPEKIGMKPYHKALAALGLYDINQIYICGSSYQKRSQILGPLDSGVQCLDQSEVIQLMESSDVIFDY